MVSASTAILRESPYFAGLPDEVVSNLAAGAKKRIYERNELIFLEGESGDGLHILCSGSVKLFMTSPSGREQVFRIVRKGGSFNEIPIFDDGPNPAGAQALESVEALILSKDDIFETARTNPDFALAIARVFAGRLRTIIALVEDLSFRSVTGRVAHLLLEESRAGGAGQTTVPFSQQGRNRQGGRGPGASRPRSRRSRANGTSEHRSSLPRTASPAGRSVRGECDVGTRHAPTATLG